MIIASLLKKPYRNSLNKPTHSSILVRKSVVLSSSVPSAGKFVPLFSREHISSSFFSTRTTNPLLSSSKMSTASIYETTFPAVPRMNGIANVTVGPSSLTTGERTIVHLKTKEVIASSSSSSSSASSLAAKDNEKDPITVTYETVDGKETRIVTASLGPAAKIDGQSLRKTIVSVVTKLRALKISHVEILLPTTVPDAPLPKLAEIITQAATLTNFAFDRYLTTEDKIPFFLSHIHITIPSSLSVDTIHGIETAVNQQKILSEGVIFARDLVNERADELNPETLEKIARRVAKEIPHTEINVVCGNDLVVQGLHLMAAVGQAARYPPRYVELLYKGDPENYRTDGTGDIIMVVGKGITHDSGGLNMKGTGFMETMYMDMGGAAAACGAALTCGRLGIKRNIVFILAIAENAVDALSFKPHNIIKSHKGLTVQIGNTDAEGRLVLADALSYGQSRHKPHTIMDMATLTGACIIALGEYAAGIFTNNQALKDGLLQAATQRWERLWPMPIFPEHREEIKSTAPEADLSSTGAGRYGGACTAAAFLENFIGHEPSVNGRTKTTDSSSSSNTAPTTSNIPAWCHIDLAGPAMYSKARGYMNAGGTGFGVQVITQYLLNAPKGSLPKDEVKKF